MRSRAEGRGSAHSCAEPARVRAARAPRTNTLTGSHPAIFATGSACGRTPKAGAFAENWARYRPLALPMKPRIARMRDNPEKRSTECAEFVDTWGVGPEIRTRLGECLWQNGVKRITPILPGSRPVV